MEEIDSLILPWDRNQWIKNKSESLSVVELEGALLQSADADRVFFAPEPTAFSVVYSLSRKAIVSVSTTGRIAEKEGVKYDILRLRYRANAIAVREETMSAATLERDVAYIHALVADKIGNTAIMPFGPEPNPSPTPKEPPPRPEHPIPTSSGVRG